MNQLLQLAVIGCLSWASLSFAQPVPPPPPADPTVARSLPPLPRIDYVVRDKDVRILSKPQPSSPGRTELTVFFWYGSPWSAQVDPYLRAWIDSGRAPADIKVDYVPVVRGPEWALSARIFYALREMGYEPMITPKLLQAVARNAVDLSSPLSISTWLAEQGIAVDAFEKAMNSPRVIARVAGLHHIAAAYEVRSTPTFVINGQFHVAATTQMPPERALAVALFLADRLSKEKSAASVVR